jgi:hypothetical protein
MEKAGRRPLPTTYSAGFTRRALETLDGFDETFPFRITGCGPLLEARQAGEPFACTEGRVAHTHRDRWSAYFRLKMSRGKWRHRVLRKFPEMGLSDGYTPQAMKLQMLMSPLLVQAPLLSLTAADALFCQAACVSGSDSAPGKGGRRKRPRDAATDSVFCCGGRGSGRGLLLGFLEGRQNLFAP